MNRSNDDTSNKGKNYTLLPYTSFPANLQLQSTLMTWKQNEGRESFIMHDGPTYTNGPAHMGHALNRIQKDFINRREYQKGKNVSYIPGFDCHGLPIETGVMKECNTKDMNAREFRTKCRDYAQKWIDIQTANFISYGIRGYGIDQYSTMDHQSEMTIVKNFFKIVKSGLVYRAKKPIWWSCSEQTSLAEAEVEYLSKESTAIYVKFPIVNSKHHVIIWTTTPWTLFANEAVAISQEEEYSLVEIANITAWVATSLLLNVSKHLGEYRVLEVKEGKQLVGLKLINPIKKEVQIFHGDFVTTEDGTGLVHIAPGHGPDDFTLGKHNGLPVTDSIDSYGVVLNLPNVKFTDDKAICSHFQDLILHQETFTHNYPCSWRSKKPLVYRSVYQWFIGVEKLVPLAIKAIDQVQWYPAKSINRIKGMVQRRPDWCISRQRRWGVPMAIFYNPDTNEIRTDLIDQTQEFLEKNGCDAWFEQADKLFPDATPAMDILDVWIESGLSSRIAQSQDAQFTIPADIYLEGSDQHRAWFQATLMLNCSLHWIDPSEPELPYKKVVTHGFILDAKGQKMSKSLGNVIDPDSIPNKDVLRLALLTVSCEDDVKFGKESLKRTQDILARFRLTLRFALGNITGDDNLENVTLLPLERWILSCMDKVHAEYTAHAENHRADLAINTIHKFCNEELSAFYFDIRKDLLYCSNSLPGNNQNPTRLSVVKCLDIIFNTLVRWLVPVIPFTTEEAWNHYLHNNNKSIHELPITDINYDEPELELQYAAAKEVRSELYKILEDLRNQKIINASHDAQVVVPMSRKVLSEIEMQELCMVTSFKYSESAKEITASIAPGERCPRCKMRHQDGGVYCARCSKLVADAQAYYGE